MTTRAKWIVAALGGLVVIGAAWFVVAVVVPIADERACASVELRAGPPVPPEDPVPRPAVGGGDLASRLREGLRGDVAAARCHDFADPYVLRVDDTYYAYSTNTDEYHLPLLISGSLFSPGEHRDALPELPAWTEPGYVWAPAVLPVGDAYVLYYSTYVEEDRECISRAVSESPAGPFVDESTEPMICPAGGGAIDPDPFVASDGRAFLYWKEYGPDRDGIVAQELTAGGLGLTGPSELVLEVTEEWEGRLVEAPTMVEHDGVLHLFYSANDWAGPDYAVGYALCDSVLGPCVKPFAEPWLTSNEHARGPGGQAIFEDEEGRRWMVVHAWIDGEVGYPDGARNLFVLRLHFVDGLPVAS